jgi:hypothetical protein
MVVGVGVPVGIAVAVGLGVSVTGSAVGVGVLVGKFLSAMSVASVSGIGAVGRRVGVRGEMADVAVITTDAGVIPTNRAVTVGVGVKLKAAEAAN